MKRVLAMMLLIIALVVVVIAPFIILGETRFATFSHQETGITSFLLASLELIGLVISIAIVVFILYQYIRYRRPYRLVFDAFSNESTLFKNGDKPLNLSILAKEELVHQFKMIYREIKVYKNQPDKRNQNLEVQIADGLYVDEDPLGNDMGLYLSVEQIKKSGMIEDLEEVFKILTDPEDINLMNLVGEIAPKEVTPIMKFIEAIFPPHIIKTTGHLQFKSDMHGITFEFVDMGNQHNLMVRTLWQPTENIADSTEKEADYYIELLRPAMHWVAIMFWEQKLISHVPFRNRMFLGKKREKRRQARVFYLLGALYYAHANQMNTYKYFFRQLSVEHLRRALDTDPDWCLPCLYLANLYSFKMIETPAETKGELRKKLLDEAQRLYEETLKRTERKKVSIYTQHRILLDRALAEINSDDDELIEQAKKVVQDITVKQGPANPANFDPNRADCATYLYNLARWYELSLEQWAGVHNAKEEARRYLAYSLARSKSPLDINYLKKHFSILNEDGDLEILLEELDKKLCEEPTLAMMRGVIFKSEIDMVLNVVDQRLNRPTREAES